MSEDSPFNVYVLDEDAETYATLLAKAGISPFGPDAGVWLAQPDLAAEALRRDENKPHWIQSTWAGVRPLVTIAAERDITVTGLKGIFAPLISEYVFARLLYRAADVERYRDAQHHSRWDATWPSTLARRRLCVIGTGSIGSYVAKTARHFAMQTVGVYKGSQPNASFDAVYPVEQINTAVDGADVIVATLPDTDATRLLIDADVFSRCPENAWFFNVGRAATVDHDALRAALGTGAIRRATIDLTPVEPLPADHPLWRTPSLEITPHIAAVSHPHDVVAKFIANTERYRAGRPLADRINLQAGY